MRAGRNAIAVVFILLLIAAGAGIVAQVALEEGMTQGVIATSVLALGIGLLSAILLR